ncbi:MAG: hypothetical protein M3Z33_10080, partial [Actinomycetota bacterium]|nr:hypothetical protein [Actinomycetota bacterium]
GAGPPGGGPGAPGGGPAGPGGNPFGGDATTLRQAIGYAKTHAGGTIATSSQAGAASQVVASGANVAGIGGFSGRESEVNVRWLADAVRAGRIRWVLTSAGGGPGGGRARDGRVGASKVMSAVTQACAAVTLPSAAFSGQSSAGGGFYDCAGRSQALRAVG